MTADPIMISPDSPPPPPQNDRSGNAAELVAEERFSIVPEWVLYSDIGDCALRLYAVLLRYSNITGARMPARSTLATRLHKKSTDTVDRGLTELVALGAVQIEPRWAGRERLTNRYRIRTSRPTRPRRRGPVRGVAAPMRLPPWWLIEVAARMRLPAQVGPGVAAPIGAGWPHESGRTESVLPRHHHPLLPHRQLLRRRARPPEEVADDHRSRSAHASRGAAALESVRSSTGDDATRHCSPTAASAAARPGTTTSPRSAPPAETPSNR